MRRRLLTCSPALLLSLSLLSVFAPASTRRPAGGLVSVEHFGHQDANAPLMILLHGVSGPSSFYRDQARFFARHGFNVLLPHYLEAGAGNRATDPNYQAWVAAVRLVLDSYESTHHTPAVIVGYSLGASVALALGSQGNGPDAIAEFYGSLPDRYFRDLKGMPPLLILHGQQDPEIPVLNALQLSRLCKLNNLECEAHIYPQEGHGFADQALRDADARTLQFFSRVLGRPQQP